MFFILSKLLQFFLMPLLWVLAFLLLSIFIRNTVWKRTFLLIATGLLLVFSNLFLENEAMRAWEIGAKPMNEVKNYDAAIILTGVTAFREDIPDRVHTRKGADRFLHPLQLYRLGKIRKFIITGGDGKVLGKGIPEAEQIEKVLLMAGVAEEDIYTEGNSRNTRENAVNTAAFLKQHPELKRLLLVTSAFHMRRSEGCFLKAGVQADTFSTDFYAKERGFTPDEILIPSVAAFENWHLLIHEVTGFIVYKLMGYC